MTWYVLRVVVEPDEDFEPRFRTFEVARWTIRRSAPLQPGS